MKILVAEDHVDNLDMLTRRLGRKGFEVEAAMNGRQAVESFKSSDPDLILMDISMPIMSGLEATAKIRELETDGRHVPIIALTAHAMENDKQCCLQAGCDAYATKPIDFKALVELILGFEIIPT